MSHSAFVMLQEKRFFKIFWFCVKLVGLQPKKIGKFQLVRAILLFLILYCVCFVLHIVDLVTTENPEVIIKGIQTFPTFIITLIDAINFFKKSDQIEDIFIKLNGIVEKSGEQETFNQFYRKGMVFVKILGVFGTVSILLNVVFFMATGESGVPIYTFVDQGSVFMSIWAIQSVFMFYSASVFWLLDSNLFLTFSIMAAYSEVLGKKFKKLDCRQRVFEECIEEHMKFKG